MAFEFIQRSQELDFLWLDMEFTGLNPNDDLVIEVGAIATHGLSDIVGEYSTFIKHDPDQLAGLMQRSQWWRERPEHFRFMLSQSLSAGIGITKVDNELFDFAQQNKRPATPLHLAGNSIYNDRKWVDRDLPKLRSLLEYRQLDVSSIKLIAAVMFGVSFIKDESHRASDDIRESMHELRALIELFRGQTDQL